LVNWTESSHLIGSTAAEVVVKSETRYQHIEDKAKNYILMKLFCANFPFHVRQLSKIEGRKYSRFHPS
jgi:hypothetical protein